MSPIYPPLLPPPDFFDLDLEAEKLKDMFKATNSLKNPLFDETGLVDLPTDDKGVLILDPESKTRMVDVEVELDCLYEYLGWIGSAKGEMGEEGKEWFEGLGREVDRDMGEVFDEWHAVVDEERRKRGLTDRWTHWAHFKGQERKGEGKDGEWIVKRPVKGKKIIESVVEATDAMVAGEAREDESVSEKLDVRLTHTEPLLQPVQELQSDENGENALLPVVVRDTERKDHVLENPKTTSLHAEEVPITALAKTICIPPSSTEDTSSMPPVLELVDLWW